ncbi:MAG TPA: isoprenylcysteine carboxylmethyltransferase family protein [Vicinamibacterales bacterium]|jgi:protein-S-isoprenylcysteine O-methyltransferase Ste14
MMPPDDHRRNRRARRAKPLSAISASEALARLGACPAEALARRRVGLGFICGALVLWLARPTGPTVAAGTAIAIAGESLRVWASGHLNKAREVTVSGPYRWSAHPLYVGSSIMGAGLAVASNSLAVAGLIALYLVVTLTAAIKHEEAFLRRTFGDRYDRYRGGSAGAAAEGHRRFSLAQATANREHRALVGLAVAVLLLVLKATYNGAFWRAAAGQ